MTSETVPLSKPPKVKINKSVQDILSLNANPPWSATSQTTWHIPSLQPEK